MIDKPTFLTGAARSGTSMTAGIINLCGAWGGNLAGPTPSNKKGMFENREIVNSMMKPCLSALGFDPMGQDPLPTDVEVFKRGDASKWRDSFRQIMSSQGYDGKQQLFYKGAKMCLMWPLWHRAFPDARWIIVRRLDKDIVNSCMKTRFMRAFKDEIGWQGWVDEHLKRFQEMDAEGLDIREVWPQEMVSGNFKGIEFVVKELGLEWKEKEVIEFISPALWNGGK